MYVEDVDAVVSKAVDAGATITEEVEDKFWGDRFGTIRDPFVFLVTVRRSGPNWDPSRPLEQQSGWRAHAMFTDGLVEDGFIVLGGPLADEHRVVHAVEAESADTVRATLARDPRSETHLHVDTIEPWTIRLDGRSR